MGADIDSDHNLCIGKIKTQIKRTTENDSTQENRIPAYYLKKKTKLQETLQHRSKDIA